MIEDFSCCMKATLPDLTLRLRQQELWPRRFLPGQWCEGWEVLYICISL